MKLVFIFMLDLLLLLILSIYVESRKINIKNKYFRYEASPEMTNNLNSFYSNDKLYRYNKQNYLGNEGRKIDIIDGSLKNNGDVSRNNTNISNNFNDNNFPLKMNIVINGKPFVCNNYQECSDLAKTYPTFAKVIEKKYALKKYWYDGNQFSTSIDFYEKYKFHEENTKKRN